MLHPLDSLLHKQHDEDRKAMEDTPSVQKARVSVERRVHSFEGLVHHLAPEGEVSEEVAAKKHRALADLTTARRSAEALLDAIDADLEKK